MLTVTPPAALALRAALLDSDDPNQAIRITASQTFDGGIAMRLALDDVRESDRKVEFRGGVILVASPEVAELLAGRTLTVESTATGVTFRLRRSAETASDPPAGNGGT